MKRRLLTLVAATALLASACSATSDGGSGPDSDPSTGSGLAMGWFMPVTGDSASYGPGLVAAVELAVKDINAAGGVNGKPVKLYGEDDASDSTVAAQAVDSLVGKGAKVLIGSGSSSISLAIMPKLVSTKTLMCSGSDSADALSSANTGGYYFHTYPQSHLLFPGVAKVLLNDGRKKIAVIGRSDAVGQSATASVVQGLKDNGVTPVLTDSFDPTATNFDALANKVAAAKPDSIFLESFAEGGAVVRSLIQAGFSPKDIYATDPMASNTIWKTVNPTNQGVLEGLQGVTAASDYDPGFAQRLLDSKKGLSETLYGAYTYTCTVLSALSAVAAKSNDPTKMKDEMIALTTGENKCTDFGSCAKLLKDGKTINYVGPSGPSKFDKTGSPTEGADSIWQMDSKSRVKIIGKLTCGDQQAGQCEITKSS